MATRLKRFRPVWRALPVVSDGHSSFQVLSKEHLFGLQSNLPCARWIQKMKQSLFRALVSSVFLATSDSKANGTSQQKQEEEGAIKMVVVAQNHNNGNQYQALAVLGNTNI